ncbi:MAG: DUF3488 and transglutaminase-like domain-containing protein [Thermodesulfovibrio sp.]|nr:DUF3488 and transglutaminase-like domain-containing protein [Thermodesulfovibrio sp.]
MRYITLNRAENYIFFLSFFIATVSFTAIIPHISSYVNFAFILIMILSILLHVKKISPPIWILNAISVFLIIMPFLTLSHEDILLPSIESLTLILSIRFLTKKTSREYLQIYLLSLLLLGSSSLFDISWIFFLRLLIMLILTVFAILLLAYMKELTEGSIDFTILLSLMKLAIFISVLSIPLSAFFFIILPRTPFPLMDIGFSPKTKTGFSSTVNLGSIREIEEDNTIVMRVKIKQLPDEELYWRIITFDTFDGNAWQRKFFKSDRIKIRGERIDYTIILEPLTENYLPTLDYPIDVFTKNIVYEYPGSYRVIFSSGKALKYDATSRIKYQIYEDRPSEVYLSLPYNISDRVRMLTEQITSKAVNQRDTVESILNFLSNYQYSLRDLPVGDNSIEDFLFNKKKGNCEYFATAMAIMLRIKGIPARVVGGFKGGTYNSIGGYYVVRASDAHLWVEAWLDGKWLRFDPSGKFIQTREFFFFHIIDYLWNSIVLEYDIKAQFRLAKSIKIPKIEFNLWILILPFFLILIYSFLKVYRHVKLMRDPLNRFFSIMKKYGYERKKNQGLEEFISTIDKLPLKQKAEWFVKEFQDIYFKDRKIEKEDLKKLKIILERLNEAGKS